MFSLKCTVLYRDRWWMVYNTTHLPQASGYSVDFAQYLVSEIESFAAGVEQPHHGCSVYMYLISQHDPNF